jgi:hypothetical protein
MKAKDTELHYICPNVSCEDCSINDWCNTYQDAVSDEMWEDCDDEDCNDDNEILNN